MNKYPHYDPAKRDQFLHEFKDRGMLRWFGFYLSDHSAAIHQQKKLEDTQFAQVHHEQMDFGEIADNVSSALIYNQKVVVEKNITEIKDHEPLESAPVIGFIEGCTELGLVINQQEFIYDEIKYLALI
ncbi:hypothetical protein [Xylocopilactobacillus apicola]|uniref:DNA-directed RNA polymerase beta subunit n=1 Tax=Xylocopilactobacillus apicola TaxID=2932184 RepID=A0AAU9CX78_9LACO|nr:hypothetical protein [Xylocopilactobacillus apicola]BDR58597.1 hypothetical protein XA3_10380 [Xylocopilactobacillus apicola]